MNKIITLLAVSALISSTAFCGEPDKELHEKCLYPTVMVLNKPSGSGTGVIVRSIKVGDHFENYVFTCAHVIHAVPKKIVKLEDVPPPPEDDEEVKEEKETYDVFARVGQYKNWSTLVRCKDYPCDVLFMNRKDDTALIRFSSRSAQYVADIDHNPRLFIGNDVIKIGCGLSEPYRIDRGMVTSLSDSIGSKLKGSYRLSVPTVSGDSGGPCYHDGKVFGVIHATRSMPVMIFPHGIVDVPVFQMAYVIPMKQFLDHEEITKYLED